MDHKDLLRNRRRSAATAYDRFIKNVGKNLLRTSLHVFVEGHSDPSFYRSFLSEYCRGLGTPKFYKCGGKRQVYAAREKVRTRDNPPAASKSIVILYLVDKDLSDFLSQEYPVVDDVFVTKFYSIENYLVCDDILEVIWTDIVHFYSDEVSEFSDFCNEFSIQLKVFYRYMRTIMTWAIHHKRRGAVVNFDLIKMGELFSVKLVDDLLQLKLKIVDGEDALIATLDKKCSVLSNGLGEDRDEIAAMLDRANPKEYVRGKYETWFMCAFVKEYLKKEKHNGVQFKYRQADLAHDGIVQSLGPRLIRIPHSLFEYLERNVRFC